MVEISLSGSGEGPGWETSRPTLQGLQVTALLSQWNTSPQLEESLFTFVAPEKAEKVNLRPVAAPVGPKQTKK
jgi:hypothetical protein